MFLVDDRTTLISILHGAAYIVQTDVTLAIETVTEQTWTTDDVKTTAQRSSETLVAIVCAV